jgi:hypothetical protein
MKTKKAKPQRVESEVKSIIRQCKKSVELAKRMRKFGLSESTIRKELGDQYAP